MTVLEREQEEPVQQQQAQRPPPREQEVELVQLVLQRQVVLGPELLAQVQGLAPEQVKALAQALQRRVQLQVELELQLGPRPPLSSGTPTTGAPPGPAPMTRKKVGPSDART